MSTIAERCLELFKQCSAIEKRTLLNLMNEDVQHSFDESNAEEICDAASDTPDHFSFSKFISFHDSFVDNNAFLENLRFELGSMDLVRPQPRKIESFWLYPSDACDDIKSISKYPNINKLLNMANAHISDVNSALDCCNIICYSNDKKSLRLHSDNESSICQTHPIATFSLGASRRIEFVPIGSHHTRVVHSVDATNNSLYVMHPGCQSILKHRVLQGDSSGSENHIRYSISFRRFNATPRGESADQAPRCKECPNTPPVSANAIPTSLMIGDSFLARLNKDRLGKK